MCGIFGCVLADGEVANILYEGLKRLEYRGYDSAGEATIADRKLFLKKDKGKIDEINAKLNLKNLPGRIGIAHTRWATHGAPSAENAHPHTDCKGRIAVVHNGIIENFSELRVMLEQRGHKFKSRTDTEVIPHLVEEYLARNIPLKRAFVEACRQLKGSYAILLISLKEPDKIFCAKKESPLIIGVGSNGMYCASDIPALLPFTRDVIVLEDNEIAIVSSSSCDIFDLNYIPREHSIRKIDWSIERASKGGFSHFTIKEIYEQPFSLKDALRGQDLYYNLVASKLLDAKKIFLVACGTSYHACMAASYIFSKLAGVSSFPVIASEFVDNYGETIDSRTAVLAVSQSGETADTLSAVKFARSKGAAILGVTNVMGSSLTKLSQVYIGQNAGPEVGVAATKTFTSQLVVLTRLALKLAEFNGFLDASEVGYYANYLRKLPSIIAEKLEFFDKKAEKLADKYLNIKSICYLARGLNSATAYEGRLKLLELAYIPAIAYPAAESKHGFISVIDKGFPVVFIAPMDDTRDKIIGNIMEVKARGASVIALAEERDREIKKLADSLIEMPNSIPEALTPVVYVVPLQLFAYWFSVKKGYDPDFPRSLAKSVTVT